MIVSESFVWMHVPKCGGTFIDHILQKYYWDHPTIQFDDYSGSETILRHESVAARQKRLSINLGSKIRIANFRRLPSWIISLTQFRKSTTGIETPRELYTKGQFLMTPNTVIKADQILQNYEPIRMSRWIRLEFLKQDFLAAFSDLMDISMIDDDTWLIKVNEAHYNKDLRYWFSLEELQHLYSENPTWRDLELKLYGSLIDSEIPELTLRST